LTQEKTIKKKKKFKNKNNNRKKNSLKLSHKGIALKAKEMFIVQKRINKIIVNKASIISTTAGNATAAVIALMKTLSFRIRSVFSADYRRNQLQKARKIVVESLLESATSVHWTKGNLHSLYLINYPSEETQVDQTESLIVPIFTLEHTFKHSLIRRKEIIVIEMSAFQLEMTGKSRLKLSLALSLTNGLKLKEIKILWQRHVKLMMISSLNWRKEASFPLKSHEREIKSLKRF
jgi:hypothetical protein